MRTLLNRSFVKLIYAAAILLSACSTEPPEYITPGIPLNVERQGRLGNALNSAGTSAFDLQENEELLESVPSANRDMQNATTADTPNQWTADWRAANATRFVRANTFDYPNASAEAARAVFEDGSPEQVVSNPAVNDIYIARLRGGDTFAVIRIIGVNPTVNDNQDEVLFSYRKAN
jgi:hypothetical protein